MTPDKNFKENEVSKEKVGRTGLTCAFTEQDLYLFTQAQLSIYLHAMPSHERDHVE